jgi:hypothetical protein
MAGEGETTFTAKIAADASQFRAELDAIVSKLQMMGGEVKNYTASMGSDFQAGFSNIISSSSGLGEILQIFSDVSTNAAKVSAEMQDSFTTAFQGIQTSSVELKDFIQGVFDSVSKIQEQIAKLDPLKKVSAKQPGKAAAIVAIEEELKVLQNLVPGAQNSSVAMQGFIDVLQKAGTQGTTVNQALQIMSLSLNGIIDKLRETTGAAQQTAESLNKIPTSSVKGARVSSATATASETGEDAEAKIAQYERVAATAIAGLKNLAKTTDASIQSILSNMTLTAQQKSQQLAQIMRNAATTVSTQNIGTKVQFSNVTNAQNAVKMAAVQAQAAVSTATANINNTMRTSATVATQTIQAAGNKAHSFLSGLGKRIVNTLTSIVISFLVYRLGRSVLEFGKQCVAAFTAANASAMEFQNTLTSRGMDPTEAMNLTNLVDELAISTGFIRNDLNQAMTQLVIRFGSGTLATKAFEVALDNARAKGIPLQTSMQQVSIAALGSLKALRQFGIQTNKDLQGNLLTPLQNLELMTERVKGGMETFIKTPLGQLERAKAAIDEFKTALGSVLIGVVGPFAQFFTFVLKGIADSIFGTGEVGKAIVLTKEKTVETISVAITWASRLARTIATIALLISAIQISMGMLQGVILSMAAVVAFEEIAKGEKFLLDQLDKFSKSTNDPFKDYRESIDAINLKIAGLTGIGEDAEDAADGVGKFVAAWEPLKLISGNLPELSKFVGNLSSGFTITKRSEFLITIDLSAAAGAAGAKAAAIQNSSVLSNKRNADKLTESLTNPNLAEQRVLDNTVTRVEIDRVVARVVAQLKIEIGRDILGLGGGPFSGNSYGTSLPIGG